MARAARDAARPARPPASSTNGPSRRRRFHVPTSAVVTLAAALLTVLILPAVTHQWDDRQKARELKAALVAEMATATGRAVGDSLALVRYGGRDEPILTRWYIDSLRIEAKLSAYFPRTTTGAWRRQQTTVERIIALAGVASFENLRGAVENDQESTFIARELDPILKELPFNNQLRAIFRQYVELTLTVLTNLKNVEHSDLAQVAGNLGNGDRRPGLSAKPKAKSQIATRFIDQQARLLDPQARLLLRRAVQELTAVVVRREQGIAEMILKTPPTGYSTTRRDLLDDLLPG